MSMIKVFWSFYLKKKKLIGFKVSFILFSLTCVFGPIEGFFEVENKFIEIFKVSIKCSRVKIGF